MPGSKICLPKDASPAPTTLPTPPPWPAARWRVFDAAHRKRNLAEYEGFLEVEASDIAELCAVVSDLIDDTARLTNE